MTTQTFPIGFEAAKAEWDECERHGINPRPYTIQLWNELTFGEQQRYGSEECRTKGAIYETKIHGDLLHITVKLPESLIGAGFTKDEAHRLEQTAHRKIEEAIYWTLQHR